MKAWLDALGEWWRALGLAPFEKSLIAVALLTSGIYLVVWLAERFSGTRRDHYRSRGFLHDLAFWCYYRLGIHDLVFMAWLVALLEPLLAPRAMQWLSTQSILWQALAYFIVGDFIAYWIHRAEHRFAPMWAFHATHHSQARLNFATAARFHPVEMIYHTLLAYVPMRLLGVQPMAWLPVFVTMQLYTAVQHTQIPWSYGPLGRVLVSPAFHAFHHSADPAHHDRNFGNIFSLWDRLFGTAVPTGAARPTHFGLAEPEPESLAGILWQPIRRLRQQMER